MNFVTLQGLTIPEGVVTQITDASGRVIWSAVKSVPVVLQVEKITSNTYAGETTYNNEQFILLDIYPKTNGTVKVTYGGLTKTITDTSGAAKPNARQVFFGTFNGVSDSVATPASGELTIEGGYDAFGLSTYKSMNSSTNKQVSNDCRCISAIVDFGTPRYIPNNAFRNYADLQIASLPDSITSIGSSAFSGCTSLALTELPSGLTSIGSNAFYGCTALALASLPDNITSVGSNAFYECENITVNKMPSGMAAIPENCFSYCAKVNTGTFDYTGITTIGKNAFRSAYNYVYEIRLPEGVVSIGEEAFYYAFWAGYGDAQLYIPSTVTNIGSRAFYNSNQAPKYTANIYCYATVPPTVTPDSDGKYEMFHHYYKRVKITVPKGCGDAYKAAAGWSEYADYITEAS